MNKGQRRVIQWDAKKNGTVLGQPYTHGQTYKEWVKSTDHTQSLVGRTRICKGGNKRTCMSILRGLKVMCLFLK